MKQTPAAGAGVSDDQGISTTSRRPLDQQVGQAAGLVMRAVTLVAVGFVVIAGLVALARRERGWECIRTATRIGRASLAVHRGR